MSLSVLFIIGAVAIAAVVAVAVVAWLITRYHEAMAERELAAAMSELATATGPQPVLTGAATATSPRRSGKHAA